MSGAVLPFTKSAHQRAFEALPWFLTGTLDAEECDMVEQHLLGCAACRAELESQRALREAVLRELPAAGQEAALARLLPRLADAGAVAQPRAPAALSRRFAAWRFGPVPAWAGMALAAQFAVIAWLAWPAAAPVPRPLAYRGLSDAGVPVQGNLVAVFDPRASLRELQDLLAGAGVRIVDGPLSNGAYVLAAPAAELPRVLARLRTERRVVRAERLDAPPSR